MKKIFNQVIDINGKTCKYPVDQNGAVFFFTKDRKYGIYALYTKRDLTGNSIIELDSDTYSKEFNNYKDTYEKEPITLFLSSMQAVKGIIAIARYKATVDNMTIEDLLTPIEGENK